MRYYCYKKKLACFKNLYIYKRYFLMKNQLIKNYKVIDFNLFVSFVTKQYCYSPALI